MTETQLVRDLKKWLNAIPQCVVWKIHGSQYQEAGIPDLIGVYKGRFFGIECKVGKNKVSVIQNYQLQRIHQALGLTFVVNDINIKVFKENFYEYFNTNDQQANIQLVQIPTRDLYQING